MSSEVFEELFVLSPSNSGTTAMAKLLLTSPRIWSASPIAEGQKLPGAVSPPNSWKPRIELDWPAIKALWEQGRPAGTILLEKSPPNLMRVPDLLRAWPRSYFVISIRNPYAFIASRLRKNEDIDSAVPGAIKGWIKRSQVLRENVGLLQGRSLVTTYEAFTDSPATLVGRLEDVFGPLHIDASAPVQVKGYAPAPITNLNGAHLAILSSEQLAQAQAMLRADAAEDLAFWGY